MPDPRTAEERLRAVIALHQPMQEEDFVQIPPVMVTVCSSCYQGNDDFHYSWPCPTAAVLGLATPPEPKP